MEANEKPPVPTNKPNPFNAPTKRVANYPPFDEAHYKNDVDTNKDSLHHTLGTGPNQAAAGDHNHDERYDERYRLKNEFTWQAWSPVITNLSGGVGVACTVQGAGFIRFGKVCMFALNLLPHVTQSDFLVFSLPALAWTGYDRHIGTGRDDGVTGNMCAVKSMSSGTKGAVTSYNNGFTVVNNYNWRISGFYEIDFWG